MTSKALPTAAVQMLHKHTRIADYPIKRRWFPVPQLTPPVPATATPASSTSLTVVSYNLLAQCLVRRSFFPYCSTKALRVSHRTSQLTAELLSLSPHIIALQEVDIDLFHAHYQPVLAQFGYTGLLAHKRQHGRHGCAIFYQHDRFDAVAYSELHLDDIADDEEFADEPDTRKELTTGNIAQLLALRVRAVAAEPSSSSSSSSSPSTASPSSPPPPFATPLDCDAGQSGVLLSNTHLYWHPSYRFVRLKQVERILSALHSARLTLRPARFHRVMCGDFNVTPTNCIYAFLTTATVDPSLWPGFARPPPAPQRVNGDKEAAAPLVDSEAREEPSETKSDGASEEALDRRIEQVRRVLARRAEWPLLRSSYASYTDLVPDDIRQSVLDSGVRDWCGWTGEAPFTHYVDRFKGTLDYILTVKEEDEDGDGSAGQGERVQGGSTLEVAAVLELLTEEQVSQRTALPNEQVSSDHLSIGAQLILIPRTSTPRAAAAAAPPATAVEVSV